MVFTVALKRRVKAYLEKLNTNGEIVTDVAFGQNKDYLVAVTLEGCLSSFSP